MQCSVPFMMRRLLLQRLHSRTLRTALMSFLQRRADTILTVPTDS